MWGRENLAGPQASKKGLRECLHQGQDGKRILQHCVLKTAPSCVRAERKPRIQLNTEIQLVIFEPLGLGQTIKVWVWKPQYSRCSPASEAAGSMVCPGAAPQRTPRDMALQSSGIRKRRGMLSPVLVSCGNPQPGKSCYRAGQALSHGSSTGGKVGLSRAGFGEC